MFLKFVFLLLIIFRLCFSNILSGAAVLPSEEVETLIEIGKTLGKDDWDFSVDPCSGENGWMTPNATKGFDNEVSCNCSYSNNTVCHVVKIVLKSQNLSGTLPPELDRLAFLQEIDLTRNYLNSTIPRRWGLMNLVIISLYGNRLTGPIPSEFGNITTLEQLVVEYNQLSGTIPQELGNLTRIKRMLLTSNNFTGELHQTLAKLTNLEYFRIGDNNFVGKIPEFIASWTNLENLIIQGSGLSGPIPSGIALLTKLTDLRISDLNGTTTFPPLSNMTNLETLILRNCNIIGELPPYLGEMTQLKKVLDVSFNKLSGEIPSSFNTLSDTDYIYLTGNSLTGPVPDWMLKARNNIDLSYNNFTFGNSGALICPQDPRRLNFFGSSSKGNTSQIIPCLRSSPCSSNRYSLHINCGGDEFIDDENKKYEADSESGGASLFVETFNNTWGFSSTGHFLEDDRPIKSHIWTNTNKLYVNNTEELYMTARLSPLSLTYYGFCLIDGNYTLKLHFAEIMFTDDKTFSSLGRRLFDVYVQGKLVLKDFNIKDEAGGVGKAITRNFTVVVTENTLEIRFYWAGKGTNAIPYKGVYGPLISAISLDHDFKLPSAKKVVSKGTVIGIVVAVSFSILLVLAILWWKGCLGRKSRMDLDLKGLGSFTLREIKAATNNFDPANKIGEGGFGPVYKGILSDNSIIAVKQLSSKSKQGNREFVNEIGMISALQHPHLVKLYGCCVEGNQLLLVYEYMENNSLARALYGPEETQMKLEWPTRKKICVGIAKGLAYLHEESRLKIVHRDIKATNVLLDKNLNPKISDFGLAKLDEEDNTHISTRIAGTYGYMAPEYAMHGYLTDKADVYSFGIVALEIVSGKSNVIYRGKRKEDSLYLLDWAGELKEKGKLMELVDPRLGGEFNTEEVIDMINIALLCTNESSAKRPAMSAVVSMLEGSMVIQQLVLDSSTISTDRTEHISSDETETLVSRDELWMASSSSASDLYPVEFDTECLRNQTRN